MEDIIFPFIKFDTPYLQQLLSDLKRQCINPNDNRFERKFVIGGVQHTFGLGGLHSVNKPEIFEPEDDEILEDADVASLYPSIIIEHKVYPPHLGDSFLKVYEKIRTDRLKAKHEGNKLVDKTLKLALNGLSGNLQSEFSWCYSPKTALTIRINGQLMLLMLLEKLDAIGVHIIQSNTDGVFYKAKISQVPAIQAAFEDWQKTTLLKLEIDHFERFYQFAINDYLGVKDGWSNSHNPKLIKTKGLFIDEITLGKGMAPMIIPTALREYFVNGVSPEITVKGCNDILKFCTYQKVGKQFEVYYGPEKTRHINRYYMSTNGRPLIKKDSVKGRSMALCADSPVTIYNTIDQRAIEDYKVNYRYYIKECYKIIDQMICKMDSLF
ncbi:MAG: hypothetical protein Q4E99_01970 [Bacillota bacterium]|nr:hypothetical protein [Bacillota bacterium]